MEVYLIRHGQTDDNIARRHQHIDADLNELGKKQIEEVAEAVAKLKPTHIITSTNLRAVESTRIIASHCANDIVPETNADFVEFKRPEKLVGKRFMSLYTVFYLWKWYLDIGIKREEGYGEFLARIIKARKYLETFPKGARVVVVSHSVFITLFLEHLCRDKKIGLLQAASALRRVFKTNNGSIIKLEFGQTGVEGIVEGRCKWRVD